MAPNGNHAQQNGDGSYAVSSDMTARVQEFQADGCKAIEVKGSEELNYGFRFTRDVFGHHQTALADMYKKWGRVLAVMDGPVAKLYGDKVKSYFEHHGLKPTIHIMEGGEFNKNMRTMESLIDAFDDFGLIRKEPVLVVGGGLVSDVCGYACASYRRSSNFIRVPTTLIGLIDASVSIKVGINHKKLKNRLGAYHAPQMTFLDFDFLKSLPEGQVRNGFAELIKISSVGDIAIWKDLVKYGPQLVSTRFGRLNGSPELKDIADSICERAVILMLKLESGNLHEIRLDRVIAYGHTWSPTLELTPVIPLRHGHAIMIDMAYGGTLAWKRGYITEDELKELMGCAHAVGLSIDHEQFTEPLVEAATAAILKTRDGKQWFANPRPLGTCYFVNDASMEELHAGLKTHKELVAKWFPDYQQSKGVGRDAFVSKEDLGIDPESLKKNTQKDLKSAPGVNAMQASGVMKDAGVIDGAEIKKNGMDVTTHECGC